MSISQSFTAQQQLLTSQMTFVSRRKCKHWASCLNIPCNFDVEAFLETANSDTDTFRAFMPGTILKVSLNVRFPSSENFFRSFCISILKENVI